MKKTNYLSPPFLAAAFFLVGFLFLVATFFLAATDFLLAGSFFLAVFLVGYSEEFGRVQED